MTKKEYLQPAMTVAEINLHVQILAGSVNSIWTETLDGDSFTKGTTPTDSWGNAMSRRGNGWGDDEEW